MTYRPIPGDPSRRHRWVERVGEPLNGRAELRAEGHHPGREILPAEAAARAEFERVREADESRRARRRVGWLGTGLQRAEQRRQARDAGRRERAELREQQRVAELRAELGELEPVRTVAPFVEDWAPYGLADPEQIDLFD
jgi:hypothetical protein